VADASSLPTIERARCSRAGRLRRAGLRLLVPTALVVAVGVVIAGPSVAADKAEKAESSGKDEKKNDKKDDKKDEKKDEKKSEKDGKAETGAKTAAASGNGGAPGQPGEAATPGSKGAAAAPSADDAASSKRRGPALLRSAQSKRPAVSAPVAAKPGEEPPPPSPLTMDALRQDMKRGKDSGGISPDAPARTKVEQVLAEMVKTRAALRDDTSKLENLTVEGLSAGDAAAPGGGPAAPGAPGQPPQKNPLDVLAKALRGIKPDQAAPIVARIDRRLAATVLLKMPPVDAGKIMGALKPDVAAEIATEIAMRAKPQHPLVGMGVKR